MKRAGSSFPACQAVETRNRR